MNKFTKAFLVNSLNFNEDEAKVVMKAQRQFPSILSEEGQGFCLDGRLLHSELGVSKAFSTWIKTNLENVDAEENDDYTVSFKGNAQFTQEEIENMSSQKRSSHGITEEYKLTLDIAKEICMVTGLNSHNTGEKLRKNSKLIRKYFILMEKAIKKGIRWEEVRHPEKKSYKKMCEELEKNYVATHDGKKPNFTLYSNNADMLNRALFGYSSKQMKVVKEVEYNNSLRDNLQIETNKALDELQTMNTNLVISNLDYQKRKMIIETTCQAKFMDLKVKVVTEFNKELSAS